MQKINQKYITSVVKKALLEDLLPNGDLTTKIISNNDFFNIAHANIEFMGSEALC